MTDFDGVASLSQWEPDIRATERLIVSSVASSVELDEYVVFRSVRFPNFYGGNGLCVRSSASLVPVDRWVRVFHEYFDPRVYRHVTIVAAGELLSDEARREALACGLNVHHEVFMVASSDILCELAERRSPCEQAIQPISTQKAKAGLFHLHLDASRHEDWFRDEGDFRALFEKTIAVAEGTETRWLVIPDPEREGQYAAALGLFFHNGVCRLQEVMTAPAFRSRGLATRLLGQAARCAREAGIEVVALLADPQSPAHRLYEGLGFADLSSNVTLMRY